MADRGSQHGEDQQQKPEQQRRQDENHLRGTGDESGARELRARLDRLSGALDAQGAVDTPLDAAKQEQGGASPEAIGNAMGLAVRVLSEFVAAVIVGAVIGWGIDHAAGTTPAFLVIFLLMGAAAGFWNVYRIAMKRPGTEG